MRGILIAYLTSLGQAFTQSRNTYQNANEKDYNERVAALQGMLDSVEEMKRSITFAISAERQTQKMKQSLRL